MEEKMLDNKIILKKSIEEDGRKISVNGVNIRKGKCFVLHSKYFHPLMHDYHGDSVKLIWILVNMDLFIKILLLLEVEIE